MSGSTVVYESQCYLLLGIAEVDSALLQGLYLTTSSRVCSAYRQRHASLASVEAVSASRSLLHAGPCASGHSFLL
eukprot:scaffold156956_cov32-Tisochrysis_lutea.AAC.1